MIFLLSLAYALAFAFAGFYVGFLVGFRWREVLDDAGGFWRWLAAHWRAWRAQP